MNKTHMYIYVYIYFFILSQCLFIFCAFLAMKKKTKNNSQYKEILNYD